MTKEELKALGLTDEQVEKINEDYGKNYVSKSQFNAKNEELKQVKGELKTVNDEIDTLKKNHQDNEDLAKQIEKLKADSAERETEYNAKIKQMEIDSLVDKAIVNAKGRNATAIKALLNLTDAEIEDGKIKGLDEQVKKIQESDSYLFGEPSINGLNPGGKPDNTGGTSEQTMINDIFGI